MIVQVALYGWVHEHRDKGLPVRARPLPEPAPGPRLALRRSEGRPQLGLALVKARLDEHQADPSIRVPWTLPELRMEWNRSKDEVAPWWAENSKESYSSGLDRLARALRNWSNTRTGRRKGPTVGFPRFKRKGRSPGSGS